MSKHLNSKFLSLLLRHKPDILNLTMDKNGWVSIKELLSNAKAKGYICSEKELVEIVNQDNKQRYKIDEANNKIRASQGHSLKNIDLNFTESTPPEILYHGTINKFLDSIKVTGLKNMNRQYLHLSADKITASNVGSRRGNPIILEIEAKKMHDDGYKFLISDNGVWLINSVPVKYIKFNNISYGENSSK